MGSVCCLYKCPYRIPELTGSKPDTQTHFVGGDRLKSDISAMNLDKMCVASYLSQKPQVRDIIGTSWECLQKSLNHHPPLPWVFTSEV